MKKKAERLKKAKRYILYCLKEGAPWNIEMLEQMSDKEIIRFAEGAQGMAEAQADFERDQV